jgi:hypothetical protein
MYSDEAGKSFEVRAVETKQMCNTVHFERSRKMGIMDLHSTHVMRKKQAMPNGIYTFILWQERHRPLDGLNVHLGFLDRQPKPVTLGRSCTYIPELPTFCGVKQSSTSRATNRRIAVVIRLCSRWSR